MGVLWCISGFVWGLYSKRANTCQHLACFDKGSAPTGTVVVLGVIVITPYLSRPATPQLPPDTATPTASVVVLLSLIVVSYIFPFLV